MNTKVEQQVECSTCPWDKFCIQPPSMTEEQVEAEIKKDRGGNDPEDPKAREGAMIGGIMSALMFAGKDRECRACTTFITKLREGPELSNRIRAIMQES